MKIKEINCFQNRQKLKNKRKKMGGTEPEIITSNSNRIKKK